MGFRELFDEEFNAESFNEVNWIFKVPCLLDAHVIASNRISSTLTASAFRIILYIASNPVWIKMSGRRICTLHEFPMDRLSSFQNEMWKCVNPTHDEARHTLVVDFKRLNVCMGPSKDFSISDEKWICAFFARVSDFFSALLRKEGFSEFVELVLIQGYDYIS